MIKNLFNIKWLIKSIDFLNQIIIDLTLFLMTKELVK